MGNQMCLSRSMNFPQVHSGWAEYAAEKRPVTLTPSSLELRYMMMMASRKLGMLMPTKPIRVKK